MDAMTPKPVNILRNGQSYGESSFARVALTLTLIVACQSRGSSTGASSPVHGTAQQTPTATSGTSNRALANAAAGTGATSSTHGVAGDASMTRPARQESGCTRTPDMQRPVDGERCGALDCRSFANAEDALSFVLRETAPLVLGVGEIHAQKGTALEASPTQRFAQLLPLLCGNARHIVIELWTSRNDCGDQRVEEVRQAQKPVTQTQSTSNQNDFLELGNVAKANRIQPHALTPSCDDFRSILAAKDQDIARMLELTATRSADLAEALLTRAKGSTGVPSVVLYGGAMHNDLTPLEGREAFSYGPRLTKSTGNRTTELDIVLREQVKDSETYRRFPWYEHFRADGLDRRFALYRLGPKSFTLIYPASSKR